MSTLLQAADGKASSAHSAYVQKGRDVRNGTKSIQVVVLCGDVSQMHHEPQSISAVGSERPLLIDNDNCFAAPAEGRTYHRYTIGLK